MAKKQNTQEPKPGKNGSKHRLILYRFTTQRFRPAGILLILMGILAFLPSFVSQLQFPNAILNPRQLAIFGGASIILGLVLYVGSVLAERRAYVQCLPDYLLVNTMFSRVFVAYQRINSVQPVKVAHMFDITNIKKDNERKLIKPLAGEAALEVSLAGYPLPEKKLRKMFTRFMFSSRGDGFVFIVPKPSALSFEIGTFSQRSASKGMEEQQRYLDPIERLKYQNNKTY
jgi:hypothetical protein